MSLSLFQFLDVNSKDMRELPAIGNADYFCSKATFQSIQVSSTKSVSSLPNDKEKSEAE